MYPHYWGTFVGLGFTIWVIIFYCFGNDILERISVNSERYRNVSKNSEKFWDSSTFMIVLALPSLTIM